MEGQITYYLNEREIGYMPQETKVDRHFPASVYEIVLSGALNRVGYRPFFNSKEKKLDLLKWFDNKDFEGRWMPEGFGQLYECCIGEYPWSPTMINYLGQEEEQDFRQETPAPCHLITTVNDFIMEKDSAFCVSEKSSYMFPSKYLFEKMNLKWNGSFGYTAKKDTVIINGQNDTLYIKKKIQRKRNFF